MSRQIGYSTDMIGFLIKKSFFDMWDNLLPVILLNLGFYAVVAMILGGMYGVGALAAVLFPLGTVVGSFLTNMVVLVLAGILLGVYAGASAVMARRIADYGKPGFAAFRQALKETWRPSLLFGAVQGALLSLILNAASVYLHDLNNIVLPFLFFLLFWFYLTWLMASQYFFALQARFDAKFGKNIRKMFILIFDNPLFTIFGLTLPSLLAFGLSIVLLLIVPGLMSVLILQAVALKLRVYKYDYLEEHPGANRRKIPWKTLLIEDRERVGTRTLKGMFFPWKE